MESNLTKDNKKSSFQDYFECAKFASLSKKPTEQEHLDKVVPERLAREPYSKIQGNKTLEEPAALIQT